MSVSSKGSEEPRELGQEEEDMNIFENQDNIRQVIHVSTNRKNQLGRATNYRDHPKGWNSPHWKYPKNRYEWRGQTRKIKYREKTIEQETGNFQEFPTYISQEQRVSDNKIRHPNHLNQLSRNSNHAKHLDEPQSQNWFRSNFKSVEEEDIKTEAIILQNCVIPHHRHNPGLQSVGSRGQAECDNDQIEIIELKGAQQPLQRRKKKPKKEIIASTSANEDSCELSCLSHNRRRRQASRNSIQEPGFQGFQPFSFVKELQEALDKTISFYQEVSFCTVQVIIEFKGPIQTLKIKSMTVGPFDSKEIKIQKTAYNLYKCQQRFSDLIRIKQNIYHGRREYQSTTKEAAFQLCEIRLPLSSKSSDNIYTKQELAVCPISINRISIVCFCSRKFETTLSSLGVTCDNCSFPSQLALKSVTLKQKP